MRKLFATLAVLGLVLVWIGGRADATPKNTDNVTICHRTASASGGNQHNGYDLITVDPDSIIKPNGHAFHEQQGNGPGGDIIPPFHYDFTTGHVHHVGDYPGRGDVSLIATGCAAAVVTTTTEGPTSTTTASTSSTTSTVEQTTTSTEAPTTSTTAPSDSTTTTSSTVPGTTVSSSTSPTTTVTTTSASHSGATTTVPFVVTAGPTGPPAAPPANRLPFTGGWEYALTILGAALFAVGALCLAAFGGRRRA